MKYLKFFESLDEDVLYKSVSISAIKDIMENGIKFNRNDLQPPSNRETPTYLKTYKLHAYSISLTRDQNYYLQAIPYLRLVFDRNRLKSNYL